MTYVDLFSKEGKKAVTQCKPSRPRQPRTYQHAPYEAFRLAMKNLNLTGAELCKQLGYGRNTYQGWASDNRMPKVASVACQALMRANYLAQEPIKELPKGPRIALLKITSDEQMTTIQTICAALSIKITLPLE